MPENDAKSIDKILHTLKNEMPNLTKHYNVETLSIFGSYSREEANKESDLDLLVTFKNTPGLFQFIRLENHLSDILGLKVDLVMKNALKLRISKNIKKDLISVS